MMRTTDATTQNADILSAFFLYGFFVFKLGLPYLKAVQGASEAYDKAVVTYCAGVNE